MQQYIIRREQDFVRLKESSPDTKISDNLRCMMLLTFSGLDQKEQLGVLASVGNEYDLTNISHAMRIQFPQVSAKPIYRKDYLGCTRGGSSSTSPMKPRWPRPRPRQVMAVSEVGEDDEGLVDEEIYYEDDPGQEEEGSGQEEALLNYSDDESIDALLSELPQGCLDDSEVVEAFATVAQFKQKRKGPFKKSSAPSSSSSTVGPYSFKASGDLSFDAKSKENKKNAVRFLKSVSSCTSCHQRGHWVGDPECPHTKKGKGKGKGKGSAKKKPQGSRKPQQVFFVLHDREESADENDGFFTENYNNEPNDVTTEPFVPETLFVLDDEDMSESKEALEMFAASTSNDVEKNDEAIENVMMKEKQNEFHHDEIDGNNYVDGTAPSHRDGDVAECFMVLKETSHCEHISYVGGSEKQIHRGANGHTRHITCKECNKTVIVGRRKEPAQMWSYLVQVALCTKFGSKFRSNRLYEMIADGTEKIAETKKDTWELVSPPRARGEPYKSEGPLPGAGPSDVKKKMVAKIVRAPQHQVWLYGIHLAEGVVLPPFPELSEGDLDILQPLPMDNTVMDEGLFKGWTFEQMATRFESENFCGQAVTMAVRNEPMSPFTFKLAFYLFGRVKIAYEAGHRMIGDGKVNENKREANPDDMRVSRTIQVPIRYDPYDERTLDLQECQVMMTEDATPEFLDAFAVNDEDPPGLAILDSVCTRTMHGTKWAKKFEQELMKIPLCPRLKQKKQLFRGIGGDIESQVVKVFPVGIGRRNGELHSAEVPGNNPMLVSRPFMQKLGTIINIGDGTVTFERLGVRDLPLRKTSKGHLAVSLLDFEAETVDIYDHLHENEEKIEGDTSEECASGLQAVVDLPEPQQQPEQPQPQVQSQLQPQTKTPASLPPQPYTLPQDSDASWERVSSTSREERASPTPSGAQRNEDEEVSPSPSYYEDGTYHRNSEIDRMDWEDQQDELQFWRMMAAELSPRDRLSEGLICEDYEHFEKEIEEGHFTVRKPSNRKSKKISSMDISLEGEDVLNYHILRGSKHHTVKRTPPFGKTWIKQIYAGAMGVTTLAVMFGMSIGVPLDIEISGWDGGSAAGKKQLHNDLMVEDPYCVILTQPCGPWGNWSRFNLAKGGPAACTVHRLREEGRSVLKSVNKTIRDRVKGGRHVFMEQPLGSQSLEEPEMSDVKGMIQDGTLCFIVVDGCMVGYKDKESGLPHKKPSYYVTSLLCAESVFSGCRCDGSHEHQPLEGNNKFGSRTFQAAEWPADLNKMVLDAVIQQASVELESSRTVSEAYPAEVRPGEQPPRGERKAKRARGRMSRVSATQSAPPVYIRPDDPLSPQPQPSLSSLPPLDDSGFRAAQAEELDPVLSMNEGERRHEWLKVDAELRKLLRDLHVQFGHPTTTTLQRILRRQGAKAEVIRAASLMSCDACGDTMRQKRPRPVKLPPRYQFNFHLQADVFYAKDNRGVNLGPEHHLRCYVFSGGGLFGRSFWNTRFTGGSPAFLGLLVFVGWSTSFTTSRQRQGVHGPFC